MSTVNRNRDQTAHQKMVVGLKKHEQALSLLTIDGTSFKTADVIAAVQALVDSAQAVVSSRATWQANILADKTERSKARTFMSGRSARPKRRPPRPPRPRRLGQPVTRWAKSSDRPSRARLPTPRLRPRLSQPPRRRRRPTRAPLPQQRRPGPPRTRVLSADIGKRALRATAQ
jgi:hypothetical protein